MNGMPVINSRGIPSISLHLSIQMPFYDGLIAYAREGAPGSSPETIRPNNVAPFGGLVAPAP